MIPVAVSMTVKWSVPPGEAQSITAALQELMQHTRAENGCEGCSLSTQIGQLVAIQYLERWKTEADMRRQVQSMRFTSLAELIERATDTPAIEFVLPTGTRGFDYADEVRRPGATS